MQLFKSLVFIGTIITIAALPAVASATSTSQVQLGSLTIINNHASVLYGKCGPENPPAKTLFYPIQGYGKQVDSYTQLNPYFANGPGVCAFYSGIAYQHEVAIVMVDLYSIPVVLYPLQPVSGYSVITTVSPKPPYSSTIAIS